MVIVNFYDIIYRVLLINVAYSLQTTMLQRTSKWQPQKLPQQPQQRFLHLCLCDITATFLVDTKELISYLIGLSWNLQQYLVHTGSWE